MLSPLLLLLAPLPQEPPTPWLSYRDGLRLQDPSGTLAWRVNGRVMLDALEAEESLAEDDQEVRRARLLAKGTLGRHLSARLQWDFTDSEASLHEGMLDWHTSPLGTLRVGHFREPFGLNARTSSAHLSFLERSSATEAFTPGRNQGVQVRERGERWSLAAGLFRGADEALGAGNDELSATARATWLPRRSEDDTRLVHLGLAATARESNGVPLRLAARPSAHLVDRLVDTGELPARSATLIGLEAALVEGPWSAEAEAFLSEVDLAGADGNPWGLSLQGAWFLTGEHRAYRDSASSFGPPEVLSPVFGGGPGAWELAARWSRVDLDEGAIAGGTMEDVTLGVNWYMSAHARWMLDLVDARVEGSAADGRALMLRLHVSF